MGCTLSINNERSDVFLGAENLHSWYFLGSRDLSRICFVLKECVFWEAYTSARKFFLGVRGSDIFLATCKYQKKCRERRRYNILICNHICNLIIHVRD